MLDDLISSMFSALSFIGVGLIYLISFAVVFFSGVVIAVKSRKNRLTLKRSRGLYLFIYASFLVLCVGLFLVDKTFTWQQKGTLLLILTFLYFLMNSFVYCKNDDGVVVTQTQKKLIENIDCKIKVSESEKEEVDDDFETGSETQEEINFSHVLSVIDKLKFYNLNKEEKAQMNELKFMCSDKNVIEKPDKFRTGINEKLSSLLKIMSKYNV